MEKENSVRKELRGNESEMKGSEVKFEGRKEEEKKEGLWNRGREWRSMQEGGKSSEEERERSEQEGKGRYRRRE